MPRMIAILLMLLLIFYIFAVMFTQLYSEATYPEGYENEGEPIIYFSNLEQSFLTLFQLMTMDEWANVVRDLIPQYRYSWLFLVIFVVITGLIVVNLIVAVICDAISTLSDPDKARLQGNYDEDSETTRIELREQIDTIEDQIGDLTRIQARTFHTLQYLTQQLQMEKEKSSELKRDSASEENVRRNSGDNKDNKDKRSEMMRKTNSAERSRRKGFAQTGFISKRKNYTDTWTQEGSDKSLRQAMITNFAKSARELQKMRDREESTAQFAKSLRELKIMREEEAQRDEEEKRKEEAKKEQADTQKMNDVLARLKGASMAKSLRDMNAKKDEEAKREEEEKKRKEAAEKEEAEKQKMNDVLARMKGASMANSLLGTSAKKEDETKRKEEEEEEEKKRKEEAEIAEADKKTMSDVVDIMKSFQKK